MKIITTTGSNRLMGLNALYGQTGTIIYVMLKLVDIQDH